MLAIKDQLFFSATIARVINGTGFWKVSPRRRCYFWWRWRR